MTSRSPRNIVRTLVLALVAGLALTTTAAPAAADPIQPYPWDCFKSIAWSGPGYYAYGWCRQGLGSYQVIVYCKNPVTQQLTSRRSDWVRVGFGQVNSPFCPTSHPLGTTAGLQTRNY